MIQASLFGGDGNSCSKVKLIRAENARNRQQSRKKIGLCSRCPGQAMPGRTQCAKCQEKTNKEINEHRAELIRNGVCYKCAKNPISPKSGSRCAQCLYKCEKDNGKRLQGEFGKWKNNVGSSTRSVAKGITNKAPKNFDWTHEDFVCRFVDYGKGNKRVIDHQIPLSCAELPGREVDWEFARVVAGLENLQLISSKANSHKGKNLDRIVLAKSKELRSQGLSGAPLFHALWDEFSEAAQMYGDWVN